MQKVSQIIHQVIRSQAAHVNTQWGEALCLQIVFQIIHTVITSQEAHGDTQWKEALYLQKKTGNGWERYERKRKRVDGEPAKKTRKSKPHLCLPDFWGVFWKFLCHPCGSAFMGSVQMRSQIRGLHGRYTPLSCHHCPSTFIEFACMKNHIRDKHGRAIPPSALGVIPVEQPALG